METPRFLPELNNPPLVTAQLSQTIWTALTEPLLIELTGSTQAKPDGLIGNTGWDDPNGAQAVAAPATVSGDWASEMPLGNREGQTSRMTREPGDLPVTL